MGMSPAEAGRLGGLARAGKYQGKGRVPKGRKPAKPPTRYDGQGKRISAKRSATMDRAGKIFDRLQEKSRAIYGGAKQITPAQSARLNTLAARMQRVSKISAEAHLGKGYVPKKEERYVGKGRPGGNAPVFKGRTKSVTSHVPAKGKAIQAARIAKLTKVVRAHRSGKAPLSKKKLKQVERLQGRLAFRALRRVAEGGIFGFRRGPHQHHKSSPIYKEDKRRDRVRKARYKAGVKKLEREIAAMRATRAGGSTHAIGGYKD